MRNQPAPWGSEIAENNPESHARLAAVLDRMITLHTLSVYNENFSFEQIVCEDNPTGGRKRSSISKQIPDRERTTECAPTGYDCSLKGGCQEQER